MRLRRARTALLLEILGAYVQVARLRRGRDLPTTLGLLRGESSLPEPSPQQSREALRVGYATERVSRALPLDRRCLTKSLVVSRLLAQRRIPATLVIGVLAESEFRAHAWVEVSGQPVLYPGDGDVERFAEL